MFPENIYENAILYVFWCGMTCGTNQPESNLELSMGLHTCRGNWQVRAVLWERDGCFVQATSPVFWATLPLDPFQSAWDGEKSTIWNGEMNHFSLLMMNIVEEFPNEVWMQTCDQTQPLILHFERDIYIIRAWMEMEGVILACWDWCFHLLFPQYTTEILV